MAQRVRRTHILLDRNIHCITMFVPHPKVKRLDDQIHVIIIFGSQLCSLMIWRAMHYRPYANTIRAQAEKAEADDSMRMLHEPLNPKPQSLNPKP